MMMMMVVVMMMQLRGVFYVRFYVVPIRPVLLLAARTGQAKMSNAATCKAYKASDIQGRMKPHQLSSLARRKL